MIPLSGIKVLDLSRLLPGPLASLVLADLGAQVDKIEDTAGGDYLRVMPPHATSATKDADPTSSVFLALNRNKRSAVIDLKKPEAKAAFLRLVRSYDVVLEQFRPGVLDRLGLSHATLLEANPRLVICALTGYGQTGLLAQRAGHDLNYLARAGVLGFQGPDDRPPAVPGFQLADVSGGLYAVIGIMGALMERAQTGKGKVVDVAMIETAMPFAIAGFGLAFGGQAPARGAETLTGGIAPYQTYATKDGGAMTLASLEPKFWMQFCAGIGREVDMSDLMPGPHQVALKEHLRGVFASKTREEWIAFAAERDCCLEPVLTPDEARRDPHLAARKMFFELPSPWGPIPQMRTPLTSPDRTHAPPPKQGEHTDAILRDAGLGDDEIAKLRASGAVR
ncbi:MAG TPA: CaiB/BaiF CoA-transferase family protein [Labilithrix sp.]|nr:CaiB/BaiF CoA-transferase family protein [Labilithrix sp.]